MSLKKHIGELNKTERGCEWKIPNFSSLCDAERFYDSSSFTFLNMPFHLRICPLRKVYGFLSLYLMSDYGLSSTVTYSFSIKKYDGTLIGTKIATYLVRSDVLGQSNGFYSFCERHNLTDRKSELLPGDTLTIVCELFAGKQTLTSVKETNILKEKAAAEAAKQIRLADVDTSSENLENLFLNKESCDTTLHVADKEYKAHRAILIARSSVLAAMFMNETSEKQTGIVNIPDCDPESFEQFLLFLYTGKLKELSPRNALHLYQTSEKYNVEKLKAFCSEFLMENLTVECLCDVVIMADKYDDTKLFTAAQKFFNKNFGSVFLTAEWMGLIINHTLLANKLLMGMTSKVKFPE